MLIYEKVSIRFNRSCGGFVTAKPERSSALGLLSSLLWWLSPSLLASSLLAWKVLEWWVLASRLLVSWPSGRRGTVLMCLQESEVDFTMILAAEGRSRARRDARLPQRGPLAGEFPFGSIPPNRPVTSWMVAVEFLTRICLSGHRSAFSLTNAINEGTPVR